MNLFFFQFCRLLIICGTKRSSEVLDSVSKQRKAYSSPFRHRVRYLLWNSVSFFLFFLLAAAFIPSRKKYLSWDSSLVCLYPKLIESNDVNWLENAAWDENKLKGNRCRPSRACARRDRQGWESKTQVISGFLTTIGCWKWWMCLEKPRSPCEAGLVNILQKRGPSSAHNNFRPYSEENRNC